MMPWFALALLVGAVAATSLPELPDSRGLWLLFAFAGLLALIPRCRLAAVAVLGMVWLLGQAAGVTRLPSALEGEDLPMACVILSIPLVYERRVRFECAPRDTGLAGFPGKIRLSWYDPAMAEVLKPGQTWRFTARLRRPHGLVNPGTQDRERYYLQHRVGAVGYVRAKHGAQLVHESSWHGNRLRQSLLEHLHRRWAEWEHRGLMLALTLGDRSGMDDAHRQLLRDTGTNHLLAISGLHISLVALLAAWLGREGWRFIAPRVWPAPRAGAVAGMIAAVVYALLAGFSIPTQRALIMVLVVLAGQAGWFSGGRLQTLSLALVAILAWDPLAVLSMGFWLSFTAVSLILFTLTGARKDRLSWGKIHFILALGLSPILAAFLLPVPWISPLANLVAVPVVGAITVPLTLLAALISGWDGSVWIAWAADGVLGGVLGYLGGLREYAGGVWRLPIAPGWMLGLAGLGIGLLLLPRGTPGRWLGVAGFAPWLLFVLYPPRPAPGQVWFTLLDVGQGLATVARTRDHVLIYDTGPRWGRYDSGQHVVAPMLRGKGITRIDRLVASHGDNDHIGGSQYLLRHFPVDQVLTSAPGAFAQADFCHAGQRWTWNGVDFEMLSPPDATTFVSENDQSCVVKITADPHSILLTGDIEARAERDLVRRHGAKLRADLLIAPHHGSNTSSTAALLDAVRPRWVLIPAGYRNPFGFPRPEVLQRYRERAIPWLATDEEGAIRFSLDPARPFPSPWLARQEQRRFWRE